jgi:sulfate permease, SulP family
MTRAPWAAPGWAVLRGITPLRRSQVAGDLLAGITLAALSMPQTLGYAKIAGMPVVTGLYTLILPMALFAVLGSSRHRVVAADSATAAILAAALVGLAVPGSARLGFLADFLSRTVLVGFLTGRV